MGGLRCFRWRWVLTCAVVAGLAAGGYLAALEGTEAGPPPRPARRSATPAAAGRRAIRPRRLPNRRSPKRRRCRPPNENLLGRRRARRSGGADRALSRHAPGADIRRGDLPARHREGGPLHRRQQGPVRQGAADKAATGGLGPEHRHARRRLPDVVGRMANEIDWTEQLGDAVLAQTDGVLDAVQRSARARSRPATLTSNEAQVVDDRGRQHLHRARRPGRGLRAELRREHRVYHPAERRRRSRHRRTTSGRLWLEHGPDHHHGSDRLRQRAADRRDFDDDDYSDDYWRGPSHIDWDNDDFYPRRGDIRNQRRRQHRSQPGPRRGRRDREGVTDRRQRPHQHRPRPAPGDPTPQRQRRRPREDRQSRRQPVQRRPTASGQARGARRWRRGRARGRGCSGSRRRGCGGGRSAAAAAEATPAASCRPRAKARDAGQAVAQQLGLRHRARRQRQGRPSSDRGRQSLGAAKLPQSSKPKAAVSKARQTQGGEPAEPRAAQIDEVPAAQGGPEDARPSRSPRAAAEPRPLPRAATPAAAAVVVVVVVAAAVAAGRAAALARGPEA